MGLRPSNTLVNGIAFPNYAGRKNVDEELKVELKSAGIDIMEMPEFFRDRKGTEVYTTILGEISGSSWIFERAWYYWKAKGNGIPPKYAEELHKTHGKVVRVGGDCSCPSPLEQCKGFAVGHYHVDTADGLKALADTIKRVMEEARVGLTNELEKECN